MSHKEWLKLVEGCKEFQGYLLVTNDNRRIKLVGKKRVLRKITVLGKINVNVLRIYVMNDFSKMLRLTQRDFCI